MKIKMGDRVRILGNAYDMDRVSDIGMFEGKEGTVTGTGFEGTPMAIILVHLDDVPTPDDEPGWAFYADEYEVING